MNLLSQIKMALPRLCSGGLMLLVLTLASCDRNEVKTYRLSKETPAPPPVQLAQAQTQTQTHTHPVPAQPQLTWTLPVGWREIPPTEMRAASFVASGSDGQTAEVAAIPMPSGGSEVDLVNMWRQMLHLPPLTADNVNVAEPVAIGSGQGKLFDLASEESIIEGKARARILVATVTRGATSWFFKMTGEESFVNAQKPAFLHFLKSVSFSSGEASPAGGSTTVTEARGVPAGNADPGKPAWTVPNGWQELPPGQMLAAKFLVATNGDVRTEVNIGTAMGGTLANVNRWRGQLGLGPVTEDALNSQSASLEIEGGKAMVVDLTGTDVRTSRPARILGVIVPKRETWFYKMMGDPQVVEQQKDVFTKFVQTVKYPNAH